MQDMIKAVNEFKNKKVLVIGDLMLDRYTCGKVSRISPEAPIQVMNFTHEKHVPGGAANVANNIAAFGSQVFIAGVAGNDQNKSKLIEELSKRGINTAGIVTDENRPTTLKQRIISGSSQLLRVDHEDCNFIDSKAQAEILKSIMPIISEIDIVILSDYFKGVITRDFSQSIIELAKKYNKKIIADGKPKNIESFKGVDLFTPNLKEAKEITGIKDDVNEIGKKLVEMLEANILITQGAGGMTVFEKSGNIKHIPTKPVQVFDVSGAGDTTIAAMALAMASGCDLAMSAFIANNAGRLVVKKTGTATITLNELKQELIEFRIKVHKREELIPIIEELKKQGKKIGFTSGNYDLIHSGHAKYLADAKKMCDVLVVGINTDKSVKLYKDINRPFISEQYRAELISSLKPVDYVFLFDERRNVANLEALKPDFYIKGGDYTKSTMTSSHVVEKYGGKAVILPVYDDISTTKIIEKIADAYGKEKSQESAQNLSEKPKENCKAIFIDRDGVINKEVEYLHEPEKFELFPGVVEAMKKMQEKGYKIIVVTTQAGIGLGYFSKEDFYKVNRKMLREISAENVVVDKIYFCPHGKRDNCECRKPKIGLILRAKQELNIDLEKSYFIGDKTQDILAGKNAACKTIGVDTGHGCKDNEFDIEPDYQAKDLLDAVNFIN